MPPIQIASPYRELASTRIETRAIRRLSAFAVGIIALGAIFGIGAVFASQYGAASSPTPSICAAFCSPSGGGAQLSTSKPLAGGRSTPTHGRLAGTSGAETHRSGGLAWTGAEIIAAVAIAAALIVVGLSLLIRSRYLSDSTDRLST